MASRAVALRGAGQGVGAGSAGIFARGGDRVVTDVDEATGVSVAKPIVDAEGAAIRPCFDVTDREQIRAIRAHGVVRA
ncbi:hypothetical protein HEP87_55240 [Streptomyces sp. S1D4-11]|nr:hypothetical protein [Streptomyces sp. S1D4-11]QIZ01149.1 hypothetical protein HEP87_55240 [Streptomyces sp. S1D4-11]